MPLDLSALVADTAHIHRDYGAAGDLNVDYHPALINERTLTMLALDNVSDGAALADLMTRVNEELCRIIARWDLTDQGVAIPLTPEALSGLPLALRLQVLSEIASDLKMGEANGSVSSQP